MCPAFNSDPEIYFAEQSIDDLTADLKIVYEYWQDLRGERFAPTWREFDMMRIPFNLLPSTLVKDVEHDPFAIRYRYYGSQFVNFSHRDYTGKTVAEIDGKAFAKAIMASLNVFIKEKKPIYYQLHIIGQLSDEKIQNQIRLPISNDGENITNIVSVVSHTMNKRDYKELNLD